MHDEGPEREPGDAEEADEVEGVLPAQLLRKDPAQHRAEEGAHGGTCYKGMIV